MASVNINGLAYDTPILLPGKNYRTIDTLQIGEMVSALDQDGSAIFTVVTRVVTQHMRNAYYTINAQLRITDDHPMLAMRDDALVWDRVDGLNVGDRIKSVDGFVEIDSIEFHDERLETVYVETQCGNFIAKAGPDHYVVKSTYARKRLGKGEILAFA